MELRGHKAAIMRELGPRLSFGGEIDTALSVLPLLREG